MLIFRNASQRVQGVGLERELRERLSEAAREPAAVIGALVRAGELEASLEDVHHPAAAIARELSDALAEALLARSCEPVRRCLPKLAALELPNELSMVRPEGYAQHALDPLAYAHAVELGPERGARVAVIGIRSIGTSLSAVVSAALRRRDVCVERLTVRPTGHPWERELALGGALAELVSRFRNDHFLIVDEGPGLSGSTFLAVAEAIERGGVPARRIELMTSRAVDPERLVARDAAQRWARFSSTLVSSGATPADACDLCAGVWRELVYASEQEWPACYAAFERHKYLSPHGDLVKFVGFPPYGEAPFARGQLLAEAGFGPPVWPYAPGYLAQGWLEGRPLSLKAERRRILPRILQYLVFRSATCRAGSASVALLELMLRLNVKEALGLDLPDDFALELVRPVYADARLSPHEWIQSPSGEIFKVDATDHGDDQFFPGPCDSAWDVAGVVIEWQLDAAETAAFCEQYRRGTRDDVAARLGPYLVAYAAFALARSQLAALGAPAPEKPRLALERQRYLTALGESVERSPLFRRTAPQRARFDRAS